MANSSFIPKVAIVSEEDLYISFSELERVVAAMQIQVSEHLKPHWGVDATLKAYKTATDVPNGCWVVTIKPEIEGDRYGFHFVNPQGLPYAELRSRVYNFLAINWTVTLSHEVMEMLVNPFANKTKIGDDLSTPDVNDKIEYLAEIADPSQAEQFGYNINGVMVSDFILPSYYDTTYVAGKQYSFTGAITRPLSLADGGYFSFKRGNSWYQAFKVQNKITYKKLTGNTPLTTQETGRLFRIVLSCFLGLTLIIGITIKIKNSRA